MIIHVRHEKKHKYNTEMFLSSILINQALNFIRIILFCTFNLDLSILPRLKLGFTLRYYIDLLLSPEMMAKALIGHVVQGLVLRKRKSLLRLAGHLLSSF